MESITYIQGTLFSEYKYKRKINQSIIKHTIYKTDANMIVLSVHDYTYKESVQSIHNKH